MKQWIPRISQFLHHNGLLLAMAVRNVARYRKRSALTLFAIALSVMVMISVRGLVNGLETMVSEQIVLGQSGAIQIHKTGFKDNVKKSPLAFAFKVDEAWYSRLRAVPEVQDATGRIQFAAMVSVGDKTVVSPAFAIDPQHEYKVCPGKKNDLRKGSLVSDNAINVSPLMNKQLGSKLMQELSLLAPDVDGVLNAVEVKLGGILTDIPLLSTNKSLTFVPLAAAQNLLRLPGQVTEVAVSVSEFQTPFAAVQKIEQVLGADYEVQSWRDGAKKLLETIQQRRVIGDFITNVFLVVALIGVTNTMLMNVLGRTREIGTMMAVGMRRRQIAWLFVSESTVLGMLGAVLGILMGVGIVMLLGRNGLAIKVPGGAAVYRLRPSVPLAYVFRTGAIVWLGAALAAIYPARRASKLKPIDALGAI